MFTILSPLSRMLSKDNKETLLTLVRLGIGHELVNGSCLTVHSPIPIDWEAIEVLAAEQGLSAVVVDGVEKMPDDKRPPKFVLLQWIGETLQGYEYRFEQYRKAISELSAFYNSHGFKMMVLKGYACALDWPKPEHRPCGDIDVWLFGQQREADKVLVNTDFTNRTDEGSPDGSKSVKNLPQNHIEIDNSHHHHSVFEWGEFMVENHYDFINVHHQKSNASLEKIFKELGNLKVESSEFRVEGQLKECSDAGCKFPIVEMVDASTPSTGSGTGSATKVYLPSPNLHALFLLRHAISHFAADEITLRQVLDWAFFVKAHTKEVDWEWLAEIMDEYHMTDFFNCINAICVEDLGFEVSIFPYIQFDPLMKERVFNDILSPEFSESSPKGFIPRVFFKYRRWKANEWKHKICYKESMWESFWSGVWNHLMKPKTI